MKRSITPQTIITNVEYLEFCTQPQQKRIIAYLVQGYEDTDGFHETYRQGVTISGQNYNTLMASNTQGKQAGYFRNDDVLAMVDRLKS